MSYPENLRYTKEHEWVRAEGDIGTIGITDHAQAALGDLVYVEMPAAGRAFTAGDPCAVVESVKAASDVYAPVAGTVIAVNELVVASPEKVNADAYGNWLYRLKPSDASGLGGLLDATAYTNLIGSA